MTLAPYRPAGRGSHGGYIARATRYPCGAIKPHRNAAGMAYTASRGGGDLDETTRTLVVFGTFDPLRRGMVPYVKRTRCPCCHALSRLSLSDAGRRRLAVLRSRYAPSTLS